MNVVFTGLSKLAAERGLRVTYKSDQTDSSVVVDVLTIRRVRVSPPQNMLDVVNNAERITIFAVRDKDGGRWKHSVRHCTYATPKGRVMKLNEVPARIRMWSPKRSVDAGIRGDVNETSQDMAGRARLGLARHGMARHGNAAVGVGGSA